MKVLILTDKKPTDCKDCILLDEVLVPTADGNLSLEDGCGITHQPIGCKCPLLEDADYFNKDDEGKDYIILAE